ncbi:MAG TPA: malto-oligosyltrehalose trehalohydrolase [Candidatus Methylomirabilis sp.]|nr:malto-oligosyltrehalose trehalohydrolase [Candidatus Methylomirabilis sp.]
MPVGAELLPDTRVHVRVWAPRCRRVAVVVERDGSQHSVELAAEDGGYFSGIAERAGAGSLYRFRLDDDEPLYPDPASRFQPAGPHGPSRVVDPSRFPWTDAEWRGAGLPGQIIYEMHVGTFTREGTWVAATREIPELAALGITCIEIMPIAEFAGRFGWGYDGVDLFAPTHLYGEPDDLRRFVDQAHRHGIAVILDVVYNHFGPDGNYLRQFSPQYFTDRHRIDWGEAVNFDGPGAGPVREFVLANARYWIDEFHMDGLRLDATQAIFDDSAEHILAAIGREVRAAALARATLVVAENETQHAQLVRPAAQGGHGLDGLWNDDFHHSAMVALTGRSEAYYTDYRGTPQEFISAVKYGYLYQGQRYTWQRQRRGMPALDVPASAFVTFIQNHDQVANSARGDRVQRVTSPGRLRAMTAVLLLAPGTPMLFQGQEFAASAPFLYFADHAPAIARNVREGRAAFLAQFTSLASRAAAALLPDPGDVETFERCKLDRAEREQHAGIYALHQDLIRLRRTDPVFGARPSPRVDGAVLGAEAFVLRFFSGDGADRLLVVNFGPDLRLNPAPEPLLAPPAAAVWSILWSSEDPRYEGSGTPPLETRSNWRIPGHAAVALGPRPVTEADDPARGGDEMTEEEETRREVLREWERH